MRSAFDVSMERISCFFTDEKNLKASVLVLGLISCWMITHPYTGIWHDARLYAVQALSRLYPEVYGNDIFIKYGVQDNFTIFSRLHAFVISFLGLGKASLVLTLIGHMIWLAAAFFIAAYFLSGKAFWLFLILLFTLPGYYSADYIFSYGEPFLTPRIYAEGFSLWGVAFFLRGKKSFTIILLFFSLLFHPLITAPVFLLLLCYGFRLRITSIFIASAFSLFIILAFVGVAPFSSFFQVMDDRWYSLVSIRNDYVFVSKWSLKQYNTIIFDGIVIFCAVITSQRQLRRFLLVSIITGLACLSASFLFADLFQNVLIIQLQIWRGYWIMHFFAKMAFVILAMNLKKDYSWLILLFIAAWFTLDHVGGVLALLGGIIFIIINRTNKPLVFSQTIKYFIYLSFGITLILCLMVELQKIYLDYLLYYEDGCSVAGNLLRRFRANPLIAVMFFIVWKIVDSNSSLKKSTVMLFVVSAIFVLVLNHWDLRSVWVKKRENEYSIDNSVFSKRIPYDAVVYWQNSIEDTWFLLGRAAYASRVQGAAMLFSPQLSMKLAERLELLSGCELREGDRYKDVIQAESLNLKSIEDLISVCRDEELDYVVHPSKLIEDIAGMYNSPKNNSVFYLYDSKYIREKYLNFKCFNGDVPVK